MAPQAPRLLHWLLLGALAVLWGSAFAATDIALQSFDPLTIVTGRVAIAAFILFLFIRRSGRRLPADLQQWRWIIAMAVLGNAAPFFLIAWGQQQVDSNVAGILMAVMPLMVLALAHRLVPGERINARRLTGMLAGLSGVALLLGGDQLASQAGGSTAGKIAILAGAMCYAVNVVVARLAPPMDSSVTAAGVMVAATVLIAPVAMLSAPPVAEVQAAPLLALIALGALATGLATVIYFEIVRGAGAGFLSLINFLVPGWAVVVGAALLGERLQASSLMALAVILAGVLLSQFGGRKREVSA